MRPLRTQASDRKIPQSAIKRGVVVLPNLYLIISLPAIPARNVQITIVVQVGQDDGKGARAVKAVIWGDRGGKRVGFRVPAHVDACPVAVRRSTIVAKGAQTVSVEPRRRHGIGYSSDRWRVVRTGHHVEPSIVIQVAQRDGIDRVERDRDGGCAPAGARERIPAVVPGEQSKVCAPADRIGDGRTEITACANDNVDSAIPVQISRRQSTGPGIGEIAVGDRADHGPIPSPCIVKGSAIVAPDTQPPRGIRVTGDQVEVSIPIQIAHRQRAHVLVIGPRDGWPPRDKGAAIVAPQADSAPTADSHQIREPIAVQVANGQSLDAVLGTQQHRASKRRAAVDEHVGPMQQSARVTRDQVHVAITVQVSHGQCVERPSRSTGGVREPGAGKRCAPAVPDNQRWRYPARPPEQLGITVIVQIGGLQHLHPTRPALDRYSAPPTGGERPGSRQWVVPGPYRPVRGASSHVEPAVVIEIRNRQRDAIGAQVPQQIRRGPGRGKRRRGIPPDTDPRRAPTRDGDDVEIAIVVNVGQSELSDRTIASRDLGRRAPRGKALRAGQRIAPQADHPIAAGRGQVSPPVPVEISGDETRQ